MLKERITTPIETERYREVILQLTLGNRGFHVAATCPHCGYPEMALLTDGYGKTHGKPIFLCRKCGHVERRRPAQ